MRLDVRARTRLRTPLRIRVLAGVLLVTLGALTAFDFAAVTALRKYLVNQTDSQLESIVGLYRPFGLGLPPGTSFVHAKHVDFFTERPGGRLAKGKKPTPRQVTIVGPHLVLRPALLDQYFVAFVSERGPKLIIEGNPDLRPRLTIDLGRLGAKETTQTIDSGNGRARLRMLRMRLGNGTIVVTTSLSSVRQTLDRLELILIVGSSVAALLVALGIAYVLRRGLRPIETMASQADRITAGDLTDRVSPQDAVTEVGRLGGALNGMLARIEVSVREREASQELTNRFFADASHELRTPLASLRANAELYQQGALTERAQIDEAMRRIVLESQRMSKLVDDMLKLARLDQHPGQQHELVDLTALLRERVDQARIADPQRTWQAAIRGGLTALGDAESLRRAVSNLLGNVTAHTPAGTVATVTASEQAGTITVAVSDDGPGVADDQLPRIFDRFYRATGTSRRPGAGLGLAIVDAIAGAHEGIATAAPTSPHGLRVTLTLPATDPVPAADPIAPADPAAAADLVPALAHAGQSGR